MPFGISAGAGAAIAGGLSAAGGIASAAMQSGTAGRASGAAQRNLELILPQMQQNYNTAVAGYQPYATAGQLSLKDQQDLLGLNGPDAASAAMAKFQTSPGYQWSLQQGLRATDMGAAARDMLRSGATLKAEQAYGTGLADQEFGNYFSRLAGLSNLGFNAAGGIASAGANLISQEEGNAQAQNAALIGGANAQNSILGNATQGLQANLNNLLSNKDFQNWISGTTPTTPYNAAYSPSINTQNAFGPILAPAQGY